jgi:HSP20 family protein
MAINVRQGQGEGGQELARRTEWDPFRWAREMLRWDPFREMAPMEGMGPLMGFAPAFEVKETKDGYVFKADLPGVKQDEIEISRTGNRLSIEGKRESEREEKNDRYYLSERSYGSFTRSFTLPEGADLDAVKADLADGVLTVFVPRKPEQQPRKISVSAPQKKS